MNSNDAIIQQTTDKFFRFIVPSFALRFYFLPYPPPRCYTKVTAHTKSLKGINEYCHMILPWVKYVNEKFMARIWYNTSQTLMSSETEKYCEYGGQTPIAFSILHKSIPLVPLGPRDTDFCSQTGDHLNILLGTLNSTIKFLIWVEFMLDKNRDGDEQTDYPDSSLWRKIKDNRGSYKTEQW